MPKDDPLTTEDIQNYMGKPVEIKYHMGGSRLCRGKLVAMSRRVAPLSWLLGPAWRLSIKHDWGQTSTITVYPDDDIFLQRNSISMFQNI